VDVPWSATTVGVGAAVLVVAAVLAALAAWAALHVRHRLRRLELAARLLADEVVALQTRADGLRAELDRLDAVGARLRTQVETAGAQIGDLRSRSERVLDVLAALPPTGAPVPEHYTRAAAG
jgi:hypothetical protein